MPKCEFRAKGEEIAKPQIAVYGTIADARNEIRSFRGFLHALLLKSRKP